MSQTPAIAHPSILHYVWSVLEFIKFSHTVFALPFALIAMLVAASGAPTLRVALLILACMASARTAAMAFNRWLDWEIDQRNPRTQYRSRLITRPAAALLWASAAIVFVWCAYALNPLCLTLSPVALLIIFGYSYTKRFTVWCHGFIGLALSVAPMGAWAAVRGDFYSPLPWLLAGAVLTWVFGFDLIYSTLDADFDRAHGLYSIPAHFGVPHALALAMALHGVTLLLLAAFGRAADLGSPYWCGWGAAVLCIFYEHLLTRGGDLGRINRAFFHMNALVGLALLIGTLASL